MKNDISEEDIKKLWEAKGVLDKIEGDDNEYQSTEQQISEYFPYNITHKVDIGEISLTTSENISLKEFINEVRRLCKIYKKYIAHTNRSGYS